MRALSLIVLTWVLTGCPGSPGPAPCSTTNCTGCCDAQGECQRGTTEQACGRSGFACMTCSAGSICNFQFGVCSAVVTGGGAAGGGLGGGDTGGGVVGGGVVGGGGVGGGVVGGGVVGGGGVGGGGVGGGGVVGGGVVGGGTGGGGAVGACSSATCAGGCCFGGICVPFASQTASACGSSGAACTACSGSATCQQGQCQAVAQCTPSTCPTGCCIGNLCVEPARQTAQVCGNAGRTCSACAGSQACVNGSCSNTAACDSMSCAGCCTNNTCIPFSNQTAAQCGLNGNACSFCQNGATCVGGSCVGGSQCNASTCQGCCNGNTCTPASSTSVTACGVSGSACVACRPGESCTAGACVTPPNRCLVISPSDVNYGAVRVGCRSPATSFNIINTCAQSVQLSVVGVSGSNEFSRPSVAPQALTASGGQATFSVTYTPMDQLADSAILTFGSIEDGGVVAYQTPLAGTGSTAAQVTETFTVPRRVDVLMVIDDSGSMQDKQMALASNFSSFIQYAALAGIDYQLGVTTTSVGTDACPPPPLPCIPTQPSLSGRLRVLNPGGLQIGPILRPLTPNVSQAFAQLVNVGIDGSGLEQHLEGATLGLTPPLITGSNAGFLRTDAALSVFILSDADDQSPSTISAYVARLQAIKGQARRNLLSVSGFLPLRTSAPSNCTYDGNGLAPRLSEVARLTGGVTGEICDITNALQWRAEAQRVGQTVFGARQTWFLTQAPDPLSPVVSVEIDGLPVPPVSGGQTNWTYESNLNAIVFPAARTPAPGQTLRFTYTPACMP